MKKLKLKLEGKQMLTKDQMKNVIGGGDYYINCYRGFGNFDGVTPECAVYNWSSCGDPNWELQQCRSWCGSWVDTAVCYYA